MQTQAAIIQPMGPREFIARGKNPRMNPSAANARYKVTYKSSLPPFSQSPFPRVQPLSVGHEPRLLDARQHVPDPLQGFPPACFDISTAGFPKQDVEFNRLVL